MSRLMLTEARTLDEQPAYLYSPLNPWGQFWLGHGCRWTHMLWERREQYFLRPAVCLLQWQQLCESAFFTSI